MISKSQASSEPLTQAFAKGFQGKLTDEFVMSDDGSGDQLRKKGDVECVVEETVLRSALAAQIDQIGYLLKSEEADGQGQDDVPVVMRRAEQERHRIGEKIGVLEDPQQHQVQDDAQG